MLSYCLASGSVLPIFGAKHLLWLLSDRRRSVLPCPHGFSRAPGAVLGPSRLLSATHVAASPLRGFLGLPRPFSGYVPFRCIVRCGGFLRAYVRLSVYLSLVPYTLSDTTPGCVSKWGSKGRRPWLQSRLALVKEDSIPGRGAMPARLTRHGAEVEAARRCRAVSPRDPDTVYGVFSSALDVAQQGRRPLDLFSR